jgi:hypothetical protein
MQRLIFNSFMVVLGKGWACAVLCYNMLFANGQVCTKDAQRMHKTLHKNLNP